MSKYKIEYDFKGYQDLITKMRILNENKRFEALKTEIPNWKEYIISIIQKQQDILIELIGQQKVEEFETKIFNFYESFFNSFKKNRLERGFRYLFDEDIINPMYRKRIYQVNHYHGKIEKIIKDLELGQDIKLYLYFKLYLDFFESFSIYLKPFLHKLWCEDFNLDLRIIYDKKINKYKLNYEPSYRPREIYLFLLPNYFNFDGIKDYFDNNFRNNLSHCDYFLEPDRNIYYWGVLKDFSIIDKHNIENYEDFEIKTRKMFSLVIWFTTAFDIKINEYFYNNNSKIINKFWFQYFKIYSIDWENYHKSRITD